jgi:phage gpG-like protein
MIAISEIRGLQALRERLSAATGDEVLKSGLTKSAAHISGWVKKNRLTGPRPGILGVVTGRLRSSITFSKAQKEGNAYVSRIGTNVVYARIHEYGGIIRPGQKGFLAWKSRDTGKWVFTTKPVKIPARPFLHPALEDQQNKQDVLNIMVAEISKALELKSVVAGAQA